MTETVTLDLDEIERKARAAIEAQANAPRQLNGQPMITSDTAETEWAHQQATQPPVVLALIARIREAERERDEVRSKLATAEMAIARAERIAKAATTFVDEQGKTMSRELLEHEHFDRADWDDLVLEVERNGR